MDTRELEVKYLESLHLDDVVNFMETYGNDFYFATLIISL
jgi:hypothetical protein